MKLLKQLPTAFLLLLALSSLKLSAQKASASYVVKIEGDTLYGTFKNPGSWMVWNARKLEFTPDNSGAQLTLKPRDCRYVFIDSAHVYIPYTGKRMTNPATAAGAFMFNDAETPDKYKNVTVFLRKVISTRYCDFYVLSDAKRINLYYWIKGKPVQELISQVYVSGGRLIEADSYRQQLGNIFQDIISKNNLSGLIGTMGYSEEGIIQLANTVNAIK